MTWVSESHADRHGARLSRDERKALRKADLIQCHPGRRNEIRRAAENAIKCIESGREIQRRNGIIVTDEMHAKNVARHVLTIECLDEIEGQRLSGKSAGV